MLRPRRPHPSAPAVARALTRCRGRTSDLPRLAGLRPSFRSSCPPGPDNLPPDVTRSRSGTGPAAKRRCREGLSPCPSTDLERGAALYVAILDMRARGREFACFAVPAETSWTHVQPWGRRRLACRWQCVARRGCGSSCLRSLTKK